MNEVTNEQIEDNPDVTLYEINEVYDVISQAFEETRSSKEPVQCIFEIELDIVIVMKFSDIFFLDFCTAPMVMQRFHPCMKCKILNIHIHSGAMLC